MLSLSLSLSLCVSFLLLMNEQKKERKQTIHWIRNGCLDWRAGHHSTKSESVWGNRYQQTPSIVSLFHWHIGRRPCYSIRFYRILIVHHFQKSKKERLNEWTNERMKERKKTERERVSSVWLTWHMVQVIHCYYISTPLLSFCRVQRLFVSLLDEFLIF